MRRNRNDVSRIFKSIKMDTLTDVIDSIIKDLIANKIIQEDDGQRTFLSIEDSLLQAKDYYGVKITFA